MYLLIAAAGMGKRMQSDRNKLLLQVLDLPILAWTLNSANLAESITEIGIIGQPYDFPDFEVMIDQVGLTKPYQLIVGGATRQESVYNGVCALGSRVDRVLIHDGARCLVTPALFDRCVESLLSCSALIAAIAVKDTIKVVDSSGLIVDTPDRSSLWSAQTPQGFEVSLLKKCHELGRSHGWNVTDDAALLERCGYSVKVVLGEETNLKITTRVDLAIAEFILRQRLIREEN